ncbi:hypothetical protein RB195_019159 [Necator americanus]|uniref:Uncharacterized protein n=1 Tax=Necator americanus TaxID=51031 RepID=A0ABR1CEN7_NECAM
MVSSPVSTASSFDAQMMQEALDLAIEDTCRGFGLLSPYTNEHDIQGLPKIDNDGLEENRKDGLMPGGDAACGSLTYDGIIFMERSKKFPASHYHIEEMNKGPALSYAAETWADTAAASRTYYPQSPREICLLDGPAESSAGCGSWTSSTSLTKVESILDDNGERTIRVEEMLVPARAVKTGHLVDHAPRLARIPSQYQLESLTEVYVCDYPTLFTNSAKQYSGEMDVEALTTAFETNHVAREPTELHQVYSEYVSEVLY